jgi:diguanylate cyclase (GGDEF)-like protein
LGEEEKRQPGTGECSEDLAGAKILRRIADDLRYLIELSVEEPEGYLDKWLEHIRGQNPINCWERKKCGRNGCPAYENTDSRCWLIAGTMCGGEVRGEFAKKFGNCTKCDVYQDAVFVDAITEIYEHLLTLTTNLKQNVQKLRNMAIRDPLTELYNRHYFNETITREIKAVERYDREISVIILDINNFKQINDTYGHLHGDGVLKACADILAKVVRTSDIVCRFGGDEFLIVTPEVECNGAHPLVGRIEEALAEWNETYERVGYDKLSFSYGCANYLHGGELLDVIREADRLMYIDKQKKASVRNNGAKFEDTV